MNNIFKMLFILFLTIGYANATDIEFNSWSGDAGSFYITNATDKIITFNILNATINNQYVLINSSGALANLIKVEQGTASAQYFLKNCFKTKKFCLIFFTDLF